MSTTLPGGPTDCLELEALTSCSSLVRWGLELDFLRMPLAGAGASKLGLRNGLL